MVLEYFSIRKGKQPEKAETAEAAKSPILNEEDEKFLNKITSDEVAPPLPERPVVILDNGQKLQGKDAQTALLDGADTLPLPESPSIEGELKEGKIDDGKGVTGSEEKKRRAPWSYLPAIPVTKAKAGSDLQAAAEVVKSGEGVDAAAGKAAVTEKEEEEQDLSSVLDQLNLSAVNNRVFSFSKESQKLMEEFNQILKDLVNGVPTA